MLNDEELAALLADIESDRVERKASESDSSAIRKNITAFANDLPGHGKPGVVFVGVLDDGRCAGLEVTDKLQRRLAEMRSDGNIIPLPSMIVRRQTIRGCDLVVIEVQPASDPPVRFKGTVFVKVGPTVQRATPDEERRLAERRRAGDLPFDMRPTQTATIDDLDLDYVRTQYLPRAVSQDVLEQNRRTLDFQLQALRCLRDGRPTYGGLLAFGRDPQAWLPGAYVQFLRVDGTAVSDPIRSQKVLTGRLEDVLRRLDDLLEANVSISTDLTSGSLEVRHPDYPLFALQQLVRNAIMHRSYENTNTPVRITWFADRVEIVSPGGLLDPVTRDNFGGGATSYRNPLVAEVMYHLGFAQRFGVGVPLAQDALRENGNPAAEFDFPTNFVATTIRRAP